MSFYHAQIGCANCIAYLKKEEVRILQKVVFVNQCDGCDDGCIFCIFKCDTYLDVRLEKIKKDEESMRDMRKHKTIQNYEINRHIVDKLLELINVSDKIIVIYKDGSIKSKNVSKVYYEDIYDSDKVAVFRMRGDASSLMSDHVDVYCCDIDGDGGDLVYDVGSLANDGEKGANVKCVKYVEVIDGEGIMLRCILPNIEYEDKFIGKDGKKYLLRVSDIKKYYGRYLNMEKFAELYEKEG